jgi:hypothetical protein
MTQHRIPSPKPRRTRAQIHALVRLYHQSGLTQQAFCREHGVCAGSLSTWLSRERAAIKGFVPATLPDARGEPGARIHFPDGLELQLPGSWQASQVVELVNRLQTKTRPC